MPRLVLVADDSPTHQRKAQGILTGEGLEVVTVSNGVAAVKKLATISPTLILADVSMPGRDGYEVCEFVKNSPELARVPVLLIYSDLEPFDEARAQSVRADGRIKKPFGQDELLATVHRFLPETEEAVVPAPPPPTSAEEPEPERVTEPVDLPPVESKIETPDLGALSESAAFGDQFAIEPPPTPEESLPSPTEEPSPFPIPALEGAGEEEAGGPESASSEPVLEEEAEKPAVEEPASPERTMMFRTPVQIAEPMLAEDQGTAAEEPGEAAATLESYTLDEAAAGEVSIAPPAAEPPPPDASAVAPPAEAEPPPPPPEEAPPAQAAAEPEAEPATSTAAVLDTDLVHWIVHNVVVRMAPPALATSDVEELIRKITDEMINELTQPPPEP